MGRVSELGFEVGVGLGKGHHKGPRLLVAASTAEGGLELLGHHEVAGNLDLSVHEGGDGVELASGKLQKGIVIHGDRQGGLLGLALDHHRNLLVTLEDDVPGAGLLALLHKLELTDTLEALEILLVLLIAQLLLQHGNEHRSHRRNITLVSHRRLYWVANAL